MCFGQEKSSTNTNIRPAPYTTETSHTAVTQTTKPVAAKPDDQQPPSAAPIAPAPNVGLNLKGM